MKSIQRWLVGSTCVAALVAGAGPARAGGETKGEKGKGNEPPAAAAGGSVEVGGPVSTPLERTERHEGAEEHEEESEPRLTLGVDFVLGFGKTDVVSQSLPGSFSTAPQYFVAPARTTTESFVLYGDYEIAKHVGIGVALPFTGGGFSPPSGDSHGTTALGNIELEGEYGMELSKAAELKLALGVALPTAQGAELPDSNDVLQAMGPSVDTNTFDRFSINKAAAASRGYESNALFEPKHLGLVPKIILDYHPTHAFSLEPYVKLENLIATTSDQAHSYTGELVLGARIAYKVVPAFEPGVRVWMNAPLSGADFKTVGVVEPELRFHAGNLTPMVGAILPFAGTLTDPYFAGIRFGLNGRF
jgi:hypothetical protein